MMSDSHDTAAPLPVTSPYRAFKGPFEELKRYHVSVIGTYYTLCTVSGGKRLSGRAYSWYTTPELPPAYILSINIAYWMLK